MIPGLSIDTSAAEQAFERLALGLERGFPQTIGYADNLLRGSISDNFAQNGRPLGWPEVQPASVRRRKKNVGGDRAILRDTDALRRSVTVAGGRAEGGYYRRTEALLEIGTTLPYAAAHQHGVLGRLAARPFLLIQPGDARKIEESFSREVGRLLRAAERGTL